MAEQGKKPTTDRPTDRAKSIDRRGDPKEVETKDEIKERIIKPPPLWLAAGVGAFLGSAGMSYLFSWMLCG